MQIASKSLRFNFGVTIALFSGGPQHERLAGQVIERIKKASNNSVSFVGVIGQQNAQHFDHIYGSSSELNEHDFDRTRNQHEVISDSILVPYRTLTHVKNNALVKKLKANNFLDDLSTKRVDSFVTVGNYSLSKRIYTCLEDYYTEANRVRPPTFLFDQHIEQRSVENESYLDFVYATLAKRGHNRTKYIFPSMCIGFEGLFKAFQFLQTFKKDPQNDSFWSENFTYDVSELVQRARSQFRESNGIKSDDYSIVFSPGNKSNEIKFFFKHVIPGLNEFLNEPTIKNVEKDFFHIFVTLPNDPTAAAQIKSSASSLPSQLKVHFIEPQQKYAAMCAADFAVLHNGEITVEAAACQLPATVVDSMSNFRAYYEYLFNGHVSPLNVSTNYHGYEQMLGSSSVTPAKLSYILKNHFERPKLKYYYTKLYRDHIQAMLSKSNTNPELRVSETGLETAAKNILQVSAKYRKLDHNVRQTAQKRKEYLNVPHNI